MIWSAKSKISSSSPGLKSVGSSRCLPLSMLFPHCLSTGARDPLRVYEDRVVVQAPSCIILIHREPPSLHHEEIIVKREEVAMILTSLRDQERKEQCHG